MYSVSKLDPKLNPEPMLLQPTGVPQEVQVQESCDYPRAACLSRLLWGGRGVSGGEVPALEQEKEHISQKGWNLVSRWRLGS